MRSLRVAAVALALAAGLAAIGARAADEGLSATLLAGWEGGATAGAWVPYAVAVKNEGGQDFNGTLVLRPRLITPQGAPPGFVAGGYNLGTVYEMPLALARGAEKRVTIYGQFLDSAMGGPGYEAELVDRAGNTRVVSGSSTVSSGVLAIGVLSDSAQVVTALRDIPRLRFSSTGVINFTAQTFPNNEAYLGGLTAVVLDNFDTSTLSQAQLQALQHYVGLGGSLILTGGNSWRRTLAPLPPALLPFRPDVTSTVSLAPLMEMVRLSTNVEASAVNGQLAPGARPVLSDRQGHHLIVESTYGSGRIVELTYNPADEPVASRLSESRESWAAAVNRASGGQTVVGKQLIGALVIAGPPGMTRGGPGRQAAEYQLSSLLGESTASALPALGILGFLLIGYILLAGPLNYFVLRRLRRRELMWVSVPLVALVATGGAYGAGVISHGSDYVVNELQVLRLAPDGGGEVTFYDALFSPRRGDLAVQLPDGSLGATTLSTYPQYGGSNGGPGSGTTNDRVLVGRSPMVSLRELTVWAPRNMKVEAPLREPLPIEAHLRLANGHVVGTVLNHGRIGVHNLGLYTVDGRVARFAGSLAPGGSVQVDGALEMAMGGMNQGPGRMGGQGTTCNVKGCFSNNGRTAARSASERRNDLMQVGAETMFNGNGVVQALVGTSDPLPSVTVGGVAPSRTVTAAFVLPVEMESVDTLAAGWAAPRVVAASGPTGTTNAITVLDFGLPALGSGRLVLNAGSPAGMQMQPNLQRALGEIYDWKADSWSPIDITRAVKITESQRGPGLVRLRIHGSAVFQTLQLASDDNGATG